MTPYIDIDRVLGAGVQIDVSLLTSICGVAALALASSRDGVLSPTAAEALGESLAAIELLLTGADVWGSELTSRRVGVLEN